MKDINIIDLSHTMPESNYSKQAIKPLGACLHFTFDMKRGQALGHFQNPKSKVSPHYLIERNGDTILLVHPNRKAYHAGKVKHPMSKLVQKYYNLKNPNEYLIGIEVVSDGRDITVEQYESLKKLLLSLSEVYLIPLNREHIIGHYEVNRIDKPFCPVWAYHPSDILRGIEHDKKMSIYQNKINMLTMDLEKKTIELNIAEVEIEKDNKRTKTLEKIIILTRKKVEEQKKLLKLKGGVYGEESEKN